MTPDSLQAHPEGGAFQEVFRSPLRITRSDGASRSALTHIYFQLKPGECSRFHRVQADEVWNLYQGALRLWIWEGSASSLRAIELSAQSGQFCEVVPAGAWQAAEPLFNQACLVGCSVGPGFEFEDFEIISQQSSDAATLLAQNAGLKRFL